MIRRPPRSTRTAHSFPTRRSSDLPVKGMFLPDRYIKGECPRCHAKDQYGDSCESCGAVYAPTELINPYSTLTKATPRSEEHTSELQSLMRISYAVFCLTKKM